MYVGSQSGTLSANNKYESCCCCILFAQLRSLKWKWNLLQQQANGRKTQPNRAGKEKCIIKNQPHSNNNSNMLGNSSNNSNDSNN